MVSTSGEPLGSLDFDTLQEGSLTWFGNFRLGAKYRVNDESASFAFAVTGWIESNNSDLNRFTGLQTGFNAWTFSPGIALGKSFGKSYFTADANFSIRTNEHSEEVFVGLEYGFKLLDRAWLAAAFSAQKSLRNGDYVNGNFEQTGLYNNNQESINFGLKVLAPIAGGFGFSAAAYGSFYADKLPAAPRFECRILL